MKSDGSNRFNPNKPILLFDILCIFDNDDNDCDDFDDNNEEYDDMLLHEDNDNLK